MPIIFERDHVSLGTAARLLHTTWPTVRKLLASGDLEGGRYERLAVRGYYITRASLQAYIRQRALRTVDDLTTTLVDLTTTKGNAT